MSPILQESIEALAKEYTGQFSYYVGTLADTKGGLVHTPLAYQGMCDVHASASLIKVLVMETVFQEARLGRIALEDTITLDEALRVEGGGALQELSLAHAFSYEELTSLMMTLSDNWATNMLIHAIGMERMEERGREIGLLDTRVKRYMMDFVSQKEGRENLTSVRDLQTLFTHLFTLRHEKDLGERMWRILGRQQFRDKIPFTWGDETVFYHKTGSLSGVEHDAGIYVSKAGNFVIIVLCSKLARQADGILFTSQVGEQIFQWIEEKGGIR